LIGFLLALITVFVAFRVVQHARLQFPGPTLPPYAETFNETYGGRSNDPVYERFGHFVRDFLDDGSIERSFVTNGSSRSVVLQALPATLALVLPGLALALLAAFVYGLVWARAGPRARRVWRWPVYVAFGALPVALALWLSLELGVRWHVFPIANYCDVFNSKTKCGGVVDWADHLVLPWITFGLFFAAVYARILRHLLSRVLGADADERPARARRTGITMARTIGIDVGPAIGLAVFVETSFQIPGVGRLLVASLYGQDFPVAETALLYAAIVGIGVHFLVDVIVAARDRVTRDEWQPLPPRRKSRVEEPRPA
jgi:peptide/nickel transport system permease protein